MRRNLLLRASMALCVAASLHPLYAAPAQTVAHVLDVTGQWRLEGSAAPIASGQALAAGARISAASNHPGDAITIVRDEDMSRQHTACDATPANPCRNPIVVSGTSSAAAPNPIGTLVEAAISVLLSRPPAIGTHYAITMTRGKQNITESEAVVALGPAQQIVLPPAPDEMPAGVYTLAISRAGEKTATTQTLQLTSDGTWHPLPWNAAGLYEISFANADGEQVADMMLLVANPAQYPAQRDALAALRSRTASWTGPAARDDEHLFLRASLLAQSAPAEPTP